MPCATTTCIHLSVVKNLGLEGPSLSTDQINLSLHVYKLGIMVSTSVLGVNLMRS